MQVSGSAVRAKNSSCLQSSRASRRTGGAGPGRTPAWDTRVRGWDTRVHGRDTRVHGCAWLEHACARLFMARTYVCMARTCTCTAGKHVSWQCMGRTRMCVAGTRVRAGVCGASAASELIPVPPAPPTWGKLWIPHQKKVTIHRPPTHLPPTSASLPPPHSGRFVTAPLTAFPEHPPPLRPSAHTFHLSNPLVFVWAAFQGHPPLYRATAK